MIKRARVWGIEILCARHMDFFETLKLPVMKTRLKCPEASFLKVFISADMEGVAAIVGREHAWQEGAEFERSRKLMTHEVNAAIEGILEVNKSATVVVNDSHWKMRNILPEELHEAAELLMGSPKPMSMMQGIDTSFDASFEKYSQQ